VSEDPSQFTQGTDEFWQSSERLFRSIFENSQIGISFFNIEGQAVFTNRAFQEMLRYTGKELSQLQKWDEIIHPDERASGAQRYAKLVQGKREKDEWEQRFIRRDGRIVVERAILLERALLHLLGVRPYRCEDCDERFLRGYPTSTAATKERSRPRRESRSSLTQRESHRSASRW